MQIDRTHLQSLAQKVLNAEICTPNNMKANIKLPTRTGQIFLVTYLLPGT